MTSSDQTLLPDDAKARAAARVGSSLDPAELVAGDRRRAPGGLRLRRVQRRHHRPDADRRARRARVGRLPTSVPWSSRGRPAPSSCRWWPGAWPPRDGWTPWSPSVPSSGATPGTTTSWPASAHPGLQRVQLDTGLPVVFGVLTTDTVDQALVRSLPDETNKGAEAARTALETVAVLRGLERLSGGRPGRASPWEAADRAAPGAAQGLAREGHPRPLRRRRPGRRPVLECRLPGVDRRSPDRRRAHPAPPGDPALRGRRPVRHRHHRVGTGSRSGGAR